MFAFFYLNIKTTQRSYQPLESMVYSQLAKEVNLQDNVVVV